MYKKLDFIVIGKSGHGKSSFIKSFIKKSISNNLNVDGYGQTTRYLSDYKIHNTNEDIYKVIFHIKSSDEFIERRLERTDNFFNNFNNIKDVDLFIENLRNILIKNKTDFDINEFDSEKRLEEIFEAFIDDSKNEMISYVNRKNTNDDSIDDSFERKIKKMLKKIYDICIEELKQWCMSNAINYSIENNEIVITSKDVKLTRLLKIENNKSYSSLVNRAYFDVPISENYYDKCKKLDIDVIRFIDTYGLDQFENLTDDFIIGNYKKLLLDEYKEISNVIFIHKANIESAVSLPKNISLIFDVKPKTMVYVVCTHMDCENAQNDKGFRELKDIDSKIYIEIKNIFAKKGIDKITYEHRAKVLNKNIYEYSCDSKHIIDFSNNIINMFKSYLNDPLTAGMKIDMELILPEKFKEIFNNDILKNYSKDFEILPARTSGALADNLNNHILGFNSSTIGQIGYFSYILYFAVRKIIDNKTDFDAIKDLNEEQQSIIKEIFYKWIDQLLYCKENHGYSIYLDEDDCKNCKIKDESCVVYRLAKEKSELMNNKEYPLYLWFSRIYDFSTVSDECKIFIKNIASQIFADKFIKLCEKHNNKLKERYNID